MADQQNNTGQSGFLKNLVNKLPYQSVDFNKVLGDLNPKYDTFQDTGMRRVEALAKNSIFYNNNSTFFNKLCKQIKYFNLIDKNNRIAQNQWQTDIINVLTKAGPILLSNFYKANNFNFEIKSYLFFEKYRKKEEGKNDNTIYGVHEYSNSWFDKDKVLL